MDVTISVLATIFSTIIILGLASIGGMLSEKTGVINLSIEGFMTIGAISYSLVIGLDGIKETLAYQWLIMPLAGLFTSLFAFIYAFATVNLKANQTIAGIALNSLAIAFSLFLINSQGASEIEIQTNLWSLAQFRTSPLWILNIAIFLGIPLIVLVFIVLNYTRYGKKIKAVGENPHAANSLGIKVKWIQIMTILFSAFFTGIAGAMYAQNLGNYFHGSTQGIGFLAVALVIFGQWKPSLIMVGTIIFGSIYAIINKASLIPGLNTIKEIDLLRIVPYALSIGVLIFTSKHSKAPKALGIPYQNQGR